MDGFRRIAEKYFDGGRWVVRVQINDFETAFLSFLKEPTDEEIKDATAKYILQAREDRLRVSAQEQADKIMAEKMALVKDITIDELKAKLNAK